MRGRSQSDAVLTKKSFPMRSIPERFRSAGAGGRKRACQIPAGETSLQVCSTYILMQEAGVEAIAGADGIDNFD